MYLPGLGTDSRELVEANEMIRNKAIIVSEIASRMSS
jgi:hypothetical protein